MSNPEALDDLSKARAECDEARRRMAGAQKGSRRWHAAEVDLIFWQGRAAVLAAAKQPVAA